MSFDFVEWFDSRVVLDQSDNELVKDWLLKEKFTSKEALVGLTFEDMPEFLGPEIAFPKGVKRALLSLIAETFKGSCILFYIFYLRL